MKTLKLFLAATFIVIAMGSDLNANELSGKQPARNVIYMSLEYAMHIPLMVSAIHQQVNPEFLNYYQSTYTVQIVYRNNVIYITGTHNQWLLFFRFKPYEYND